MNTGIYDILILGELRNIKWLLIYIAVFATLGYFLKRKQLKKEKKL